MCENRSEIRNDEELNEILSNAELDDAAKAEAIKTMVGENFVPTKKYNTEKQNTKTQQEAYNSLKEEFDKFKASKMTDEEKQIAQAKKMQEQYQKANLTISKMYAENAFAKAGFKEEDYTGILDGIVTEDPEKTKVLAETICNSMLKQKEDIEKAVKAKIIKGTQTPPAGNDNDGGSESKIEQYKRLYAEAQESNNMVNMATYTRLIQQELQNSNE